MITGAITKLPAVGLSGPNAVLVSTRSWYVIPASLRYSLSCFFLDSLADLLTR